MTSCTTRAALWLAAGLALGPGPAAADETWMAPGGRVVYLADLGATAVLEVPDGPAFGAAAGGPAVRVYVPGLGGNHADRGVHDGYWAGFDGIACEAALTSPEARTTQRWGRVRIVFDRRAFPTGFTMLVGSCFDAPGTPLRAELP